MDDASHMSLKSVTVGTPREASTTGHERRRSSRNAQTLESCVRAVDSSEEIDVSDVNLSRHGVGFCSKSSLTLGDSYIVEIGFGDQKLISEIRIVSCRKLDTGGVEVGAEFC